MSFLHSYNKLLKSTVIALSVCFLSALPVHAMSTYIKGAHNVNFTKYDDLTTNNPAIGSLSEARRAGLGENDWSTGKLQRPAYYTPTTKIPGTEISGYFDDCNFVIRVPDKWNGRLVVVGAPGFGIARSADALISDYVLTKTDAKGGSYAYAVCDKGTIGENIPDPDGKMYSWAPAMNAFDHKDDSLEEWNVRFSQLTAAAREVLQKTKKQLPAYTYIWGYSNGGYVTRYAMEKHPELYSGMLDWEGVLWRGKEKNLISSLTTAVNAWEVMKNPKATAQDKSQAVGKLTNMGVDPKASFLWPIHGAYYWLPTLNVHRMKYDPQFVKRNWWEFLSHPEDYKDYKWFTRSAAVKKIVALENTGKITKPTITVHGTMDSLLFPAVHAKAYEELVKKNGDINQYRLYMVANGNHFDSFVGNPKLDPNHILQPLLPYVHQSFDILVDWVEKGNPAPKSLTIVKPSSPDQAYDIRTGKETAKY